MVHICVYAQDTHMCICAIANYTQSGGFVCAFHTAGSSSNPKHTFYAYSEFNCCSYYLSPSCKSNKELKEVLFTLFHNFECVCKQFNYQPETQFKTRIILLPGRQIGRQVSRQVGRYVGRLVGRNEETNSSDRYWTRECQELKDEKDIYLLAGFKELSQLLFCEQKSSSKASQLKKYFLLTDSYHQI